MSYKDLHWLAVSLLCTLCLASIAMSLHTLASPPEPQTTINDLLSVGFTLTDPEGHEVDRFDE